MEGSGIEDAETSRIIRKRGKEQRRLGKVKADKGEKDNAKRALRKAGKK